MTTPTDRPADSSRYEIRLGSRLDDRWADWFGEMTLTHAADGSTVLTGPAVDQAALHGVLRKVRDLGLPLLAVTRIDPIQPRTLAGEPAGVDAHHTAATKEQRDDQAQEPDHRGLSRRSRSGALEPRTPSGRPPRRYP
jgi:hypothetical protein